MLFLVLFEDNAAHAEARQRLMKAHLEFLKSNSERVRAAGPIRLVSGTAQLGGVWLLEASSLEEVQDLCRSDPFWPTGLRKAVHIFEWHQVFADGKQLIEPPE